MSWNTVMADFQTILNRDDCSDAQAQVFMQQSVQRIQRVCRLPSMERAQIITAVDPMNFVLVPADMIQPIDFIWIDDTGQRAVEPESLEKLPYRDLIRKSALLLPKYYARSQAQYWIKGNIMPGEQLQLIYYGNFSQWATADSDNELSASTPDLMIYGALSYAGDYFEMDQAAGWEQRFQAIRQEVGDMAVDLDAEGGFQVIQPVYRWE